MDHTVTVGNLLLIAGLVVSLLVTGFGALMVFAGGMSSNPSAGDEASKRGCVVFLIGLVVFLFCLWTLVA